MLLVTDVFLLLTQVLLWILVGLAARFILLQALPKAFLGSLVLTLLVVVTALTFFSGSPGGGPDSGVLGEIWQLISVIFNPLGLILVLLGIVWWDVDKGKGLNKTSKVLLRVGIIALLLMSLPLVSNFLVQRAELEAVQVARTENVALPAGARRVIVLMGQDTTRMQLRRRREPLPQPPAPQKRDLNNPINNLLQPPETLKESTYQVLEAQTQLTEHGDRILYAANLYRQEAGNAPLIVVTSGQYPGRNRKDESKEQASSAVDVKNVLLQMGIPDGAILVDPDSPNVRASAENVRKLLEKGQVNYGGQLMLVTSGLEASRTSLTFQNEFGANGTPIEVISRPTDFYTIPPKESLVGRAQKNDFVERGLRVGDFVPSIDSLEMSSRLVSESLNSFYYFLRGWLRPLRAG